MTGLHVALVGDESSDARGKFHFVVPAADKVRLLLLAHGEGKRN